MAKKCWAYWGTSCGGVKFYGFRCAEQLSVTPGGCGINFYQDGALQGTNQEMFLQIVPSQSAFTPPSGYGYYGGTCDGCPDQTWYDCINGNCTESSQYKTPGHYKSLEECQSNCGANTSSCNPPFQCVDPSNFCPPGKVCVPQDEWGQITNLVHQNISKHCH